MKVAVLRFPGSNCDQDAYHALNDDLGVPATYVWHDETTLRGFDAAFVPGGFSFGDYLRCGAMAAHSPIMEALVDAARGGMPILGVCNGFQILCEAGLLPGALLRNDECRFICRDVFLGRVSAKSLWTAGADRVLRIPIAHGEGRYVVDEATLAELKAADRIAFRYVDAEGRATPEANPNGSVDNIAGVLNEGGNVLGMMPHPERATRAALGSDDGLAILNAFRLVTSR